MKSFFTIAFCLTLTITQAQYFIPAMDNSEIGMSKEAYVVTNAGDTVRGRVLSAMIMSGQLRSFTIKDADDNKQKFKSTDVKLLAVKASFQTSAAPCLYPISPELWKWISVTSSTENGSTLSRLYCRRKKTSM
ncbi:hypothetical protein [Marinoscillum luteum]|uniref:DUF4369 domain-containing protein n=1 Tax=Marinoscillum luteum TaxID=861051 RepID=A0ABW7N559_9BACT